MTKTEAILYKQSGEIIEVSPTRGNSFTLEELQCYVGGLIQIVTLNENYMLIINEEGKFSHNWVFNDTATFIARDFNAIHEDDYIVGDALVCSSKLIS